MKKLIFTLLLSFGFLVSQANYESNNLDPDSLCSVTLDTIQGGFCIQANPTGTAPFSFFWSDSTTQDFVCPNSPPNGDLCVTVVDALGCVATACAGNSVPPCEVYINTFYDLNFSSANLTAIAYGDSSQAYSYNWSNGAITESTTVTSTGTYCVTVTDASNCTASNCTYVDLTFIDSCAVYLDTISGSNCLTAFASGTAPFTYQWSNGDLTQTACSNNPIVDTLCVTITDANGCQSTACGIVGDGINCSVTVGLTATGLTALTNDSLQNYTYEWSNGEIGQSINPTLSGTYCVTITTPGGCQATACYSFASLDEISGYIFIDSVNSGNIGVNTHKIYLIQHDTVAGTLTAIDSQLVTTTPNNWGATFQFLGVSTGNYLVKVALEPGSDEYDTTLPTYYGGSLFWDEATIITSPGQNNNTYIDMIIGTNPGGPGFIEGLISEGANIVSGQAEVRGEGDPIANVSVLLLTENDEPISHTITDANGEFEFPSVAYGTYKVIVEVLGKEQGIKMVTLSADAPTTVVDFEVNEEYVTKIEDVLNGASLKLFPNPVTETLNVQVEIRQSVDLNISVINLLGETVFANTQQLNEGIQTMGINLENLPQGIYFLNLSDGQEILSQKIMKQ